MTQVIALVSQMPKEQLLHWLALLNRSLKDESVTLEENLTRDQCRSCEIAIVANPSVEQLLRFPNLKWAQSLWAGVEGIIQPAKQLGFSLTRLIDPHLADAMAEAVLTWCLFLHRKIPTYQAQQKQRQWRQHPQPSTHQCTVGILGMGELGHASARCLVANGFQVVGWSRIQKQADKVLCYSGPEGLNELLGRCHILVCLLPLTEQTRGLLNRDLFDRVSNSASIINFSRGALLVEDDLIAKLDSNELYHAVLDVFAHEPLDEESELWGHSKISVLPHIAATTDAESASKVVATNVSYYRDHGVPETSVDLDRAY